MRTSRMAVRSSSVGLPVIGVNWVAASVKSMQMALGGMPVVVVCVAMAVGCGNRRHSGSVQCGGWHCCSCNNQWRQLP